MHQPTTETRALSIAQFCNSHGISRASYYNLRKAGNAPTIFKVGKRTLISVSAAEAWMAAMTAASSK